MDPGRDGERHHLEVRRRPAPLSSLPLSLSVLFARIPPPPSHPTPPPPERVSILLLPLALYFVVVGCRYPSVVLQGDHSVGEFYSVALTNNCQQADTGTKMIHVGQHTRSRIVSKGISAGRSANVYRGLVQVLPGASHARNYSQCDSMLIGDTASASTYPYLAVKCPSSRVEHEASTSKIGEEQLFYFQQRGISADKAVGMIIGGFCREVGLLNGQGFKFVLTTLSTSFYQRRPPCVSLDPQVFNELPLEFAAEVNQLMSLKLEGSVG